MISANPAYICAECKVPDNQALRRTVRSLFNILGPHQQMRDFKKYMNIASKNTISRALKLLSVERTGNTHKSIYTLRQK